jgi:hypothetical protein
MKYRIAHILLGFLLAAVLAELGLRLLPVSTGYGIGAVNSGDPVARGTPWLRYVYSRDWSFHLANSGTLNNFGFRASSDYVPDPRALVVVGNSYVQADALEPRDTMTERLGGMLHRPAYAVGADGFSLADYLAASRWAGDTLGAGMIVVLLTNGDLSHGCRPSSGKHYLHYAHGAITLSLAERAAPSAAKQLLNGSRLFRYLFDNLQVAASWHRGWGRDDDEPPDSGRMTSMPGCADAAFEEAATQFLLTAFRGFADTHGTRIVFIVAPAYRREQHIAAGGWRDIDTFAVQAERAGFPTVRMDSAFTQALDSGVRLDFLPIDGHWNAAANALAARAAADGISRLQIHGDGRR